MAPLISSPATVSYGAQLNFETRTDEASLRFQPLQDTLLRLMSGQRVGLALDQFNVRYSQIAVRLTQILNKAEVIQPDISDLAGLWMSNNDARSYALMGDPAAYLPVVDRDKHLAVELVPIGRVRAPTPLCGLENGVRESRSVSRPFQDGECA